MSNERLLLKIQAEWEQKLNQCAADMGWTAYRDMRLTQYGSASIIKTLNTFIADETLTTH